MGGGEKRGGEESRGRVGSEGEQREGWWRRAEGGEGVQESRRGRWRREEVWEGVDDSREKLGLE